MNNPMPESEQPEAQVPANETNPEVVPVVEPMPDGPTEAEVTALIEQMQREQNLRKGIAAGMLASFVGAAIWTGITFATETQWGLLAVGIGFMVGLAVRTMGKGLEPKFGVVGAVFSALAIVMGNFLTIVVFASAEYDVGFFAMLGSIDYAMMPSIMIETAHPMDLLFYGIALWCGYSYSFRKIEAPL